jgi:hypothetical protein
MASAAADPRWAVLAQHRDEAIRNLALAVRTWDDRNRLGQAGGDLPAILEKAVQKALQDGYASFEQAAEAVLDFASEAKPQGRHWHQRLLTMALSPTVRRPALTPSLAGPLDELRRFRHVVIHAYPGFDMEHAASAIAAARRVAIELPAAFDEFGRAFGLLG